MSSTIHVSIFPCASAGPARAPWQNRLVRPSRLAHQMQQRLMFCRDTSGRDDRRHLKAIAKQSSVARRSCVRRASTSQCNNPSEVPPDPRGPKLSPGRRHIQQNPLHSIAPKAPSSPPFAIQPNQQVSKSKRAPNLQKRDSVELRAGEARLSLTWIATTVTFGSGSQNRVAAVAGVWQGGARPACAGGGRG